MKQYINAINFDVTKQCMIHKDVEKMYDSETLSVSVVENWGKTNRLDQTYCLQTTDDFTAVILYIKSRLNMLAYVICTKTPCAVSFYVVFMCGSRGGQGVRTPA